jgi:hypothetical protein
VAEELRKREEQEASQKWKKEELLRQQEEDQERLERGTRHHTIWQFVRYRRTRLGDTFLTCN